LFFPANSSSYHAPELEGILLFDNFLRVESPWKKGRHIPISISKFISMNPLKPCGACLEWLKKIAEVNPSFSVITFTDSECKGVYVEEIDMM
jgi:hypothetical protein